MPARRQIAAFSLAAFSLVTFMVCCAGGQDREAPLAESTGVDALPDDSTDDSTDDSPVVSRKIAMPAAVVKSLDETQPLAALAGALSSGQFEFPPDVSSAELLRHLNELSRLSDELAADYRDIQANLTQAQAKAAVRILLNPESISDADFYLVGKLGLSALINQVPTAAPQEQSQTFSFVLRQLQIGATTGLRLDEIRNAMRIADYLERYGDPRLAVEACSQFADIIRSADNPRFEDVIERLEDTVRRLGLIGAVIELSGNTLDGRPIQWSDYRGKVVLVRFWSSRNIPSVAEHPQLKRLYEAYHDLGFEIVGVSMENDRAEIEAVIAKESLPWANLFSDDGTSTHPLARKYGVRTIPTALLVNADGRVVSTQARGLELERWLHRLFGPQSFVARDLAALSQWGQVSDELQRLTLRHPAIVDYRVGLAAAQLLGQDPLGYAGTCQTNWLSSMSIGSPNAVELLPMFCMPGEHGMDRSEVYDLAVDLRAESDSTQSRLGVIVSAYRIGNDRACLELELVEGDPFSLMMVRFTQAMAAHRLGRLDEAAQWLDEGRRIRLLRFTDYFLSPEPDLPYEHWICCAVAQLQLSEAEARLAVTPPEPDQP